MNRLTTNISETTLALTFRFTRGLQSPNPFHLPGPADLELLQSSPEEFYAVAPEPPRIDFCASCEEGSFRDRFSFPSPYISPYPQNNIARGLANLHTHGKARAALIILHGHTMTTFSLLEYYARPAMRMGMDVYFLALPYHMQRKPHGTWSGQYSLNSNIPGTALAFMQGVRDLRALMSWIAIERKAPVFLVGVSLGAYTSLMSAVVDDRPKAIISILGGGSLAQLIWDGYQMNRSKNQLEAGGVTLEALEQYWKLLGPGNWQPKINREQVLLIAGKYDPIVTPSNVKRLWQAWNEPALHWYPAGHATIMTHHHPVRDEIFRFLKDHF